MPQELADWNARYEAKFGHIFIICASGKSAREMLDAVKGRCETDIHLAVLSWPVLTAAGEEPQTAQPAKHVSDIASDHYTALMAMWRSDCVKLSLCMGDMLQRLAALREW